jgi:glycerol transport system substrate-binding protein
MLSSTPLERRKMAWLYAQFTVAKTMSDIQSEHVTKVADKLGGLVEFYRSPARVAWTPTGTNVPDYPKLAQLW